MTRHKPADPLRKADWDVRPIDPMVGRALIARYHYAGSCSSSVTECIGLVRRENRRPCGVTWWMPPTRPAAGAVWHAPDEVLALSRLVVVPDMPTNAASFLLMRAVAQLAPRWKCLVTWADTERGHSGGIYRAAGWEYLGLSEPTDVWVDAEGRRTSRRIKAAASQSWDDMRAAGFTLLGYFHKHRFRLVRTKFPTATVVQPSLFDLEAARA